MRTGNGQRSVKYPLSPRSEINASALLSSAVSLKEPRKVIRRRDTKNTMKVLEECLSLPILSVKKLPLTASNRAETGKNPQKCAKPTVEKTSDGFDSDDSVINELAEILSAPVSTQYTRTEENMVSGKGRRKGRLLLRAICSRPVRPAKLVTRTAVCLSSRTSAASPRYKLPCN